MTRPIALVTGAAAGIGRATSRRLADAGYLVGAYDVDEAGLATLADAHPSIVTGPLDVRDAQAWQDALERLTEPAGGRLDLLVNNAGILRSGRFADIPLADQQRIVEVNVTGVLNGCHTAYPFLRRTPGAQVVNLASASAIYGQAELATYSATKFAVRGLTEALDLEWAEDGIRVTAIWPLFVSTGMVEGMDIGSTRTLGIHLTADDVAETILRTVQSSAPRGPHSVHVAVGRQAKAFMASASLAPSWLMRTINRRVSGV